MAIEGRSKRDAGHSETRSASSVQSPKGGWPVRVRNRDDGGDEVCETVFRRVPQKAEFLNKIRTSTPSKFRQLPPYALLFPSLLGGWMEGQWRRI